VEGEVFVSGHTHVQVVHKFGSKTYCNPGSVGQPRDHDWRAGFAILDLKRKEVEYYRTPYNVSQTQAKMEAALLPLPLYRRLELGR